MTFKEIFLKSNINSVTILLESFDTPLKVKYTKENTSESKVQKGYFEINNKEFMILIEILNVEKAMLVNFYQKIDNTWVEKQTDNLSKIEVLSVFSTIINEVQLYLKKCDFLILQPNDSKKFTIYNQLVKKFNKLQEFNVSTDGKSIFLERKNKILDITIFTKLKYFKL